MKSKILYILLILSLLGLGVSIWLKQPRELVIVQPKPPTKLAFREASFAELPGWDSTDLKKSLLAFQTSCRAFIKQNPEKDAGTRGIALKIKDWQPACHAALEIPFHSTHKIKLFFEEWFAPVEFFKDEPVKGLFTGYYLPLIKGSLKKTEEFSVPLYERPSDLVTLDLGLFIPKLKNQRLVGRVVNNQMLPYYTREEITKGAIASKARVLLWINSPIDRLFLEIQGSGIIALEDGSRMYVGYDGQNGAPYTAIAGVLIKQGVMTKDNASMQGIKHYLEGHPSEMDKVINQNQSFVFFRKLGVDGALGSQGVVLTPGYSLAIDKEWIPMGMPLWLSTTRPDSLHPDSNKPMQRLMIAQDTGGAIKGNVRGDVFWGGGNKATVIAGHMKNEGHYWLFLPKHIISNNLKSLEFTN